MNESTNILLDLHSLNLKEVNKKTIGKIYIDGKNDFSKVMIKSIVVHELEMEV